MKFPHKKIIAFEGLDNCFKETNYKAFINRLRYEYGSEAEIHIESFPRYGNQNCMAVEKWLDGSYDREICLKNPKAVCSFYMTDRFGYWFERVHGQRSNAEILYSTAAGQKKTCFVFDRYNISNAIYNPRNAGTPSTLDITYETTECGIPKADIVVWMRMRDFNVLEELIAKKKNKDKNELDLDFLYNAWVRSENFLTNHILEECGIKVIVIEILDKDGNIRSKKDLADEVWNKIMDEEFQSGLELSL